MRRLRRDGRATPPEVGNVATVEPPVNGKPLADTKPEPEPKPKTPLWEFLQDEERDVDGTETWIYRLQPIIDRKVGEHCICKKRGRFQRDDILREFGSGLYMVHVNNARGKSVYRENISFHNPDFPPRVDQLEVVIGDPRNDTYFRTWAKKSTAAVDGNVAVGKEPMKGETAEILKEVFERGTKVDPTLVDLWKDTAQQRDELAKLLSERKADQPPQAAAQPDVLSILTQVKALQADPLAMLEKMRSFFPARDPDRVKEQPPQRNSLDDLKNMLEVFGQAKELFSPDAAAAAVAGPSPDADLWERIAVNVSGQIAPTLQALAGVIMAFRGNPGAAATPNPAPPVTPPMPTSFDPYRDQAAMRNYAAAARAGQNSAGGPVGPQPVTASGPAGPTAWPAADATNLPEPATGAGAQVHQEVGRAVTLINQALSCMNRGIDGHQCAQAVIDLNGDLVYDALVQQIQAAGIPVVIELAKSIPEISAQVVTYEHPLKEFLGEFLEGPEYGPEDTDSPAA